MSAAPPRLFAVIPAAGHSRRMGRPKLLLPLGETTVIGRLLSTLDDANFEAFVLVRPDDDALNRLVAETTATIIQPDEPPPEMRISVEHLLRAIEAQHQPCPHDGWLLIPADHPLLSRQSLDKLVSEWRANTTAVVLPTYHGRRGHPAILPWSLAASVFALPAEVGVNQLLRDHPDVVREVPVNDPMVTFDLDTPDDYERALQLMAD